ncbi:DUF2101 family protein [Paenibacillus sp. J22TS3]|uniref:DUF2101 family protein n=1 Tax=Paenibacillus sp. J22TS3 TaxID=2807192 RepID=UPI001FD4C614|nr:DUF2101 family protein [Paenibacillus sp. J22TS3]
MIDSNYTKTLLTTLCQECLIWIALTAREKLLGYQLFNTFPSKETLTSITVCGFSAFLLLRHYGQRVIRFLVAVVVILICLLVGVSRIYFQVQFPSDVAAGYVFGGVWVSLNVILLEILRKLQVS